VLQAYGNIQCRDAVLAWSGTRATGRSRWDGRTSKVHPVTGNQVPDETAQVPIVELIDPKPAPWPEADFIVGNPPFLGNKRMRDALGDGYAEALRAAYPDVPDSVDFVLYWWHKAARAVRSGRTRRFGLITTNSLTQTFNRRVIAQHTTGKRPMKLLWAIPDHPWTDEGAAVRIAMTVGGIDGNPRLGRIVEEVFADTPEAEAGAVKVGFINVDALHDDLSAGANLTEVVPLKANHCLSCRGMELGGAGFMVSTELFNRWGRPPVVHPYRGGQDLTDIPRGVMVIDLFGLSHEQVRKTYPHVYQHVLEHVKPERDVNVVTRLRDQWWIFRRTHPEFRPILKGLSRYIGTCATARHRVFQMLDGEIVPDDSVVSIASSDAFVLGVLSSRTHHIWFASTGSKLEDRPRYLNSKCFDPFPFPDANEPQKVLIRDLAERLDAHRKAAQARGATITGMYNLLAKLRSGELFTDQERALHEIAQTEILRQFHDELDAAVADAYGWPVDLPDADLLVNLVALNKERAAEEARGLVRWLRPEYQAPETVTATTPALLPEEKDVESVASLIRIEPQPWPRDLKDQLGALRAVLTSSARLWTLEAVTQAFRSRGRYRESIAAHLDLLTDLGMLSRVDTPEGPRWHRLQAMGA
jgi:hypothetical protein